MTQTFAHHSDIKQKDALSIFYLNILIYTVSANKLV